MADVSRLGLRSRIIRRTVGALAAFVAAGGVAIGAPPAVAAPAGPTLPVEFDLARYQPVDPTTYRSLAYADNGRSFFTAGRWMCQIGQGYRYVGCKGHPATAPRGASGAAIAGDQQGPWWVMPDDTYHWGSRAGFRPPVLGVGKRVTIAGVTCTVPRPDVVACRTGARALIFTPAWHKFFFPSWDTLGPGTSAVAHSPNPAPRYLPPRLQYWNQLPASPPAPK
ncbi:hypothetical protein [Gordonia paraffinivorans]|uniref:hypothetical protein n=1 Tax=Gordonia paraffinivorans TaxID=175628 RepID=UPI00104171F5|nr:hypothetical protein [Gordonia paraffinivorans]